MATDDILLDQIAQCADAGADVLSIHLENGRVDEGLELIERRGDSRLAPRRKAGSRRLEHSRTGSRTRNDPRRRVGARRRIRPRRFRLGY
jgi:hypothetical protein